MMTVEQLAKIAHEANRAYCETLGDTSQPRWEDAPDWQQESARMGVVFHLEHPEASASASHESWLAQKEKEGWVWGETKNPEKKEHPCCVPYEKLPEEQQIKDYLFRGIVHAISDTFTVRI